MARVNADRERKDDWLSWRWIAGALAGGLMIGGLFLARGAEGGAVYAVGLALSCAAALIVYGLIATAYGPTPFEPLARFDPLPANGAARWALGAVCGGAGLWALFAASASTGFAYDAALGLFGAAVLFDFLLIKDWFDRQDRRT